MPLVTHKVAEVVARLSAFEEDVPGEAPEQLFAEFHLQEQGLLPVEVVPFDAAEPLEAVRTGELVERGVSIYALPKETDGHGCVPDEFAVAADVKFLVGVAVVADSLVVKIVPPLDQVAVTCPVGVVAGVYREVVADAVAPAVCICGLFDGSVVLVVAKIDVCMV